MALARLKAEPSGPTQDLFLFLKEKIIGQDEALKRVASAFSVAQSGRKERGVRGAVLIAGPDSTGKSSVIRALAEYFFGNPTAYWDVCPQNLNEIGINQWILDKHDFLKRKNIDSREESKQHKVRFHQRLVVSEIRKMYKKDSLLAKAVRTLLTDLNRRFKEIDALPRDFNPSKDDYLSFVGFDEIDQGSEKFFDFIDSLLRNGELMTDSGSIDFRNSFVVVNANISDGFSRKYLRGSFGFNRWQRPMSELVAKIKRYLKGKISSRMINLFDEVIILNPLDNKSLRMILEKELAEHNFDFSLVLQPAVKEFLLDEATARVNEGVVGLKEVLRHRLLNPIVELVMADKISEQDSIIADLENREIVFYKDSDAAETTTQDK